MRRIIPAMVVLFIAACSSGDDTSALQTSVAQLESLSPQIQEIESTTVVTQIVEVEVEVEVTRIVIVTATPTDTPPGPTLSPQELAATATTAALGPLIEPHGDGFYLVGIDIAPGLWRSEAGNDSCYWQRSADDQDIIDNHFGDSGGVVRLQPSDFQIEFSDCGTFEYIGP